MLKRLTEIAQLYSNRKKRLAYTVPEFMGANKELLIIIADPKTDEIVVGFNGKLAKVSLSLEGGKKDAIIKKMLKTSKFNENFGAFTVSVAQALFEKTVSKNARIFFSVLDGMLFNINQEIRNIKNGRNKN